MSLSASLGIMETDIKHGGLAHSFNMGLSDRVGGNLELGCNPPRRRTLRNQTNALEAVTKASHLRE
jgi:hypothetical protein